MTLTKKLYTKRNFKEMALAEEEYNILDDGPFSPVSPEIGELFAKPENFAKIVLNFEPFEYQAKFLRDMSNRQCLIWGRQAGKSISVAAKAIYHAMLPNQTILVLAPTQRQSGILFEKIKKFITNSVMLLYSVERMTQTLVQFKNGSYIYALPTGDGTGIRGFSANGIIVDEAAWLRAETKAAITPMLAATNGWLILMGTPFGKQGYFYESYKNPKFSVSHIITKTNPLITQQFLDEEKNNLTEIQFRQEYFAEFIEDLDAWFTKRIIQASIEDIQQLEHPDFSKSYRYYLGVDVARHGADETVLAISRELKGIIEIVNIQAFYKKPTTHTEGLVKELHKEWRFSEIYVDETGLGGGLVDSLVEARVPITPITFNARCKISSNPSDNNKEAIYKNMKWLMEKNADIREQNLGEGKQKSIILKIPDNHKLIHQLSEMRYEYTSEGTLKIFHPETSKSHNDYCDAMGLSLYKFIVRDFITDLKEEDEIEAFNAYKRAEITSEGVNYRKRSEVVESEW